MHELAREDTIDGRLHVLPVLLFCFVKRDDDCLVTRNSLELSTEDKEREGESREALGLWECNRTFQISIHERLHAFCYVDFIVKIGTLKNKFYTSDLDLQFCGYW